MPDHVDPNKLNERDKRRVENIRDRLRAQNVGEDEAMRLALEQVTEEAWSGKGGGSSAAGEPQKHTQHGGATRTGSKSGGGKYNVKLGGTRSHDGLLRPSYRTISDPSGRSVPFEP